MEYKLGSLATGGNRSPLRIIAAFSAVPAVFRFTGSSEYAAPAYVVGLGGDLPVWPRQSCCLALPVLTNLARHIGGGSSYTIPRELLSNLHFSLLINPVRTAQTAHVCHLLQCDILGSRFHTHLHFLQIKTPCRPHSQSMAVPASPWLARTASPSPAISASASKP